MHYFPKIIIAGFSAGILNGWLGGGGGLILVPLLTGWIGLDTKKSFATSVLAMLPVSLLSALMFPKEGFDLYNAMPYILGGAAGALISGRFIKAASPPLLKRIFGALMLAAGVWRFLQ